MANPFDQFDAAPASGPVYGPPPKAPAPPSPLQMNADARADRAEQRASQAEARAQAKFEQEMAAGGKGGGDPVPVGMFSKIDPQVSVFTGYQGSQNTFQDDFGGNLFGGIENTAQAIADVGTPGQRDWWANFSRLDNQVRNELFGATLTPSEQSSYLGTTITPRMSPTEIRANLKSRVDILGKALSRQREFMLANGYKAQAVDALFAPVLQKQAALAESAEQATDKQDEAPPALSPETAPPAGGGTAPPSATGPTQLPGEGMDNGGGGAMQLAQGGTETVDNPALAGVRGEYLARLQRGQGPGELVAWAKSAGVHPSAFRSIIAQAMYRAKNPNVPIEQYDTSQLDDMAAPLSGGEQMINSAAQSPLGTAAIAAGDAASGFTLDNLIGATGGNEERARLGMKAVGDMNPVSDIVGTVGGGMLSALAAEAGLGVAGLKAGVARTLGADALYGASAGAGGTDKGANGVPATTEDRLVGAGKGALASFIGSGAGNLVAKGARGVADTSVQAVRDAGIPMTLGQMVGRSGTVGKAVKGVEDRLAGIPVVGDMINARRTEGLSKFNNKAFDKALEPIKKFVGDAVGEEAVEVAQREVSDAFGRALNGKMVQADPQFATQLTNSITKAAAIKGGPGPGLMDNLKSVLEPHMPQGQTAITGETMQIISRDLREMKAAYKKSEPAFYKRIAGIIDETEDAVFGMFKRQAPEVLPDYNAAKQAHRRVSILQDAVNKAKNQEGIFTPGQLGMTDRANTVKYEGAGAAARGDSPFHGFQRAAQDVLPNRVPDSGTAGRVIIPALALGGGGAADQYGGTGGYGIGLGAVLAGAYTKAGQRILTKPARGATSKAGKALAGENARKAIAAGGAASAAALTTQ